MKTILLRKIRYFQNSRNILTRDCLESIYVVRSLLLLLASLLTGIYECLRKDGYQNDTLALALYNDFFLRKNHRLLPPLGHLREGGPFESCEPLLDYKNLESGHSF